MHTLGTPIQGVAESSVPNSQIWKVRKFGNANLVGTDRTLVSATNEGGGAKFGTDD